MTNPLLKALEELDNKVGELVLQSRESNSKKRELRVLVRDTLLKGEPEISRKETDSLVGYIVHQLVTEKYCERNIHCSYEDDNIIYIAKSVPALKKDLTRYFMSGDSHFFYKLGKRQYLVGRMDGMGHGAEAGIIVLVARHHLDEYVREGIYDPKLLAENLNEKFSRVFRDERYTTLLVSLLEERRILLTNVGNGDTFLYRPSKEIFERIRPHGLPIGMLPPEYIEKLDQPYIEEERTTLSGFTMVSYTDGINDRDNFDRNNIKRIIMGNIGNVNLTISQIFEYADKLDKILEDDSTVIGLYIK